MPPVNGVLHMSVAGPHACKAAVCPAKVCGSGCIGQSRHLNQAYDAVLTLATGIAPFFRDGGSSYLAGTEESRKAAMVALRATSLSSEIAASGRITFAGPHSTNRDKWNFGYVLT